MQRRRFIGSVALASAAALAGCLGDDDTVGDDDDPFDVEPAELLLDPSAVDDIVPETVEASDTADDPSFVFSDADIVRIYLPFEPDDPVPGEIPPAMCGVWRYDEVDDAQDAYDEHVDPFEFGHDVEAVDTVGVDGHHGTVTIDGAHGPSGWDSSRGYLAFRDANAFGVVVVGSADFTEGERESYAEEIGQAMHESWRS